jgi:hypothetical protein
MFFFATPMSRSHFWPGFCHSVVVVRGDVSRDWVIDHVRCNKLNNTRENRLGES